MNTISLNTIQRRAPDPNRNGVGVIRGCRAARHQHQHLTWDHTRRCATKSSRRVFAAASARAAHPAEREPTCQPSAADGRRSTGERHDPAGTGGGTCHATLGRATRNTHTHVIVATAVINRNINAFTYGSAVLIEKSWPKQARHA